MTNLELFEKLYKIKPEDKILLLTHNDLDGAGAAILLSYYCKNIDIISCNNAIMSEAITKAVTDNETNEMIKTDYDAIIACDISVSESDAEIINNHPNNTKFILIDHHKTAEFLNKYDWAAVESNLLEDSFRKPYYEGIISDAEKHESGTSLLYNYLEYAGIISEINYDIKDFTHIVAAYDTWDWKNIFTNADICYNLSTLFNIYGFDIFVQEFIKRLNDSSEVSINAFEKQNQLLLTIEKNKKKNLLKDIAKQFNIYDIIIDNKVYKTVIWTGNQYLSDVFMTMKEEYPDADLYLINYNTGISLRCNETKNIDVSEIAKKFGGGGHKAAGGFKIQTETQLKYIESAMPGTKIIIPEN